MEEVLVRLRKKTLELAHIGKDANIQSIFSSFEILWSLYDRILDISLIKEGSSDRDVFICSKGQATLGLLLVLAEKGILDQEELDTYCQFDSRISMQADRTKFPCGVEASAGSLGHGLPIAVGMAMAKIIKGEKGRVFVMTGDGEMNEGTNWEALALAAGKKLNNLYLIVDDNRSLGEMLDFGDLKAKLNAFGFSSIESDGHNVNELENGLNELYKLSGPKVLIAKTRRGWGSKTLMTKKEWFHKVPDEKELQMLMKEIDQFDPEKAKGYVLKES